MMFCKRRNQDRFFAIIRNNIEPDFVTANYDSDEVIQLYVSFSGSKVSRPSIALKGFKRVFVAKGGTVARLSLNSIRQ